MAGFSFPRDIPCSFQDLRNEIDRVLERVWHAGLNTAPLDGQDWAPCMDVVEDAREFVVRVEVPGLKAEDVEVSLLGGTLTVRGCKPAPAGQTESQRKLRAECRYGSFLRKLELPEKVDEAGISASCKAGVLEIRIPKAPQAQGKTVKVASE